MKRRRNVSQPVLLPVSQPSVSTTTTRRPPSGSSSVIASSTASKRRVGLAKRWFSRSVRSSDVAVAGEVRADDDLVVEGADRGAVARPQPDDELLGGHARPLERGRHAGAGVDEHDRRNRLQTAGEVRNRLAVSVVEDLEVVAGECRDEIAVAVEDGRRHGDRFGRRPEDGRLLLLGLLRLRLGRKCRGRPQCREDRGRSHFDSLLLSARGSQRPRARAGILALRARRRVSRSFYFLITPSTSSRFCSISAWLRGLEVQAKQRLGVRPAHVEVPVRELGREPVERVGVAVGVLAGQRGQPRLDGGHVRHARVDLTGDEVLLAEAAPADRAASCACATSARGSAAPE